MNTKLEGGRPTPLPPAQLFGAELRVGAFCFMQQGCWLIHAPHRQDRSRFHYSMEFCLDEN